MKAQDLGGRKHPRQEAEAYSIALTAAQGRQAGDLTGSVRVHPRPWCIPGPGYNPFGGLTWVPHGMNGHDSTAMWASWCSSSIIQTDQDMMWLRGEAVQQQRGDARELGDFREVAWRRKL